MLRVTKRTIANRAIAIAFNCYSKATLFHSTDTSSRGKSDETTELAVVRNVGLRNFLKRTYICAAGGILTTLGIPALMIGIGLFGDLHLGSGLVLGLGGAIGLSCTRYDVHRKLYREEHSMQEAEEYYSTNSLPRQLSFASLVLGMGLTTTPIIVFGGATGILAPALLSTSFVFGGATWYAATRRGRELSMWGPALAGGLLGMVGCGMTGIASQMIFGPNNMFSAFAHDIDLYVGIPLFTGLVVYDTYCAIEMYQERDPDHLGCAATLYLDFLNLFIRMMILMDNKSKRDNKD